MSDPLEGFKPIESDPLANFKPVAGPVRTDQDPMSPDEFGTFVKTGELPNVAKVKQLRSLPRSLINTPEDLAVAYGIDAKKISPYDLNQAFQDFKSKQGKGKSSGVLDTFMRAIKKGATAPLVGAEQGISRAFSTMIPDSPGLQSSAELSDLQARIGQDVYSSQNESHPVASAVGQGVGELPYALALPGGPISGAAKKASALGRVALGGAIAGASQPIVDPNQSRATNAAIGGVTAPLMQMGLEGGVAGLSKLKAAMPGSALPAQYDVLQREIRSAGMEPTAADLVTNPTSNVAKLRDIIANAPFGNFAKQNEANKIAAGQLVRNMQGATRQKMLAQPVSGLEELRAAADAGNDQAKLFLDRIASQGASPGRNLQADINAQTFLRQSEANKAFSAAEQLAPTASSDISPLMETVQKQRALAESAGAANRNVPLVSYLQRMETDLGPEGIGTSYPALDRLLKGVREKQTSMLKPGSEITGNEASHALTEVKGALKGHLQNIEVMPENMPFAEAMGQARRLYRERVAPMKSPEVEALMGAQPDIAAKSLIGKSPEETAQIVKALGPRGRAAHFYAIVDELANEAATNRATPDFQFQRGAFLDKLKAAKGAIGEVATPIEKSQIDSIERVMQHMDQIDKTEFKQPNYTRWIWSQPNVLLKPLLTTDWGKRALLTLSASKVGSPVEKRILQAIEQRIPQIVAATGTNSGNPVNDVPITMEDEQQ